MPTIYIDGKPYTVRPGQNLLQAVLELGFDLPYFCWHPALGSVGACRQCAVKQFKDENDTRGRLVMACMTPADEGLRLSLDDPEAKLFRASVIEWLMTNHPHDCPVCDEGGECHLQDMTHMTGHVYRSYRFPKRTFRNQNLGPFINHEMNRCIQCYRCVRFYHDYAGGHDFGVFAQHNHVYFGRHTDGTLESEFSGNLVEICPTGVFDDKTFMHHYTRKWDLQTAPSLCVHCGLGCNTIPGERYGTLRRQRSRYNSAVNGYYLCDRGRFGYEFVNAPHRLREPLARSSPRQPHAPGDLGQSISREAALGQVAEHLGGSRPTIGIGSPRATIEANYALRTLVGPEHFYLGLAAQDERLTGVAIELLRDGPTRTPTLRELESADAFFILGEDITQSAPMMALALRQWFRRRPVEAEERLRIPDWNDGAAGDVVHQQTGPLYSACTHGTKLDEIAARSYCAAPDDLARLGFAVAHALDADAPAVHQLAPEMEELAAQIAGALAAVTCPVVIAGTTAGSEAVMRAAASVAWALTRRGLTQAGLALVVPECNSVGLGMLGGGTLAEAFTSVSAGMTDTAIILENDLFRRAPTQDVELFFSHCRHTIVLDHLRTPTVARAELALPAATFAEGSGTLVNNEGRAQRFYQVFPASGEVRGSWQWLRDIFSAAGRPEGARWETLDDLRAEMAEKLPILAPVSTLAPGAGWRMLGMKIPRQAQRYTGRTAMTANVSVHEHKPPDDPDTPLAFSMEGYDGAPPAALNARFWAPGWNSVQALNRFQQEIGGPLRGGEAGRRLIEPSQVTAKRQGQAVPQAFRPREGEWLMVSIPHIFGSEELSVLAPAIQSLVPGGYVGLRPEDAVALQAREGSELILTAPGVTLRLAVRLMPSLAPGTAGLPVGLPGLGGVYPPFWARLSPVL